MKHISERERDFKSFINLTVAVFVRKQLLWTLRTWAQHSPPCCSNQHRHYHPPIFISNEFQNFRTIPPNKKKHEYFVLYHQVYYPLPLPVGWDREPACRRKCSQMDKGGCCPLHCVVCVLVHSAGPPLPSSSSPLPQPQALHPLTDLLTHFWNRLSVCGVYV